MTLTEFYAFIGGLTNDAAHDRYSTSDIDTELENTQKTWNLEVKVLTDTASLTLVAGTRQYDLSSLTGTPIDFGRVTHKGLELQKVSKVWMDQYSGDDWTANTGTPKKVIVEATDPDVLKVTVHPTPQSGDTDAPLIIEYVKAHTPMSSSGDVPFLSGTSSNYLLRPYDQYLGYDTAATLLLRDPSQENLVKAQGFRQKAMEGKANLIQVFKDLESEEPRRLRGGRYWASGNAQLTR